MILSDPKKQAIGKARMDEMIDRVAREVNFTPEEVRLHALPDWWDDEAAANEGWSFEEVPGEIIINPLLFLPKAEQEKKFQDGRWPLPD